MRKENLKPTFYSLLYLKSKNLTENLTENSRARLAGYIRCCEVLRDSLKIYGYELVLLTNNAEMILKLGNTLHVKNIHFELDVPRGIKFFSAHHKIDVFKYLATKGEGYSILLDCDIVCINRLPPNMQYLISMNIPMYYDITNQRYPRHGRQKLIDDKSKLMNKPSIGQWGGGEFIGGDGKFFSEIYSLCMSYWKEYKKNYKTMHHQGDEMLTSCAIEEYQLGGRMIFNIDTVGGISRYWSTHTFHVQKNHKSIFDNFLIHLPEDKKFISNYTYTTSKRFINDYKKHLGRKKLKNYLYAKAKELYFFFKGILNSPPKNSLR